jgi:ATP-binding cassette subfamily F protein 3
VQSRIKQLAKLERLEVDEEDTAALRLKFPPAPRSGSYPVILENVTKRYGDHLIFENATFTLNRGDKVAFVGKNGEGKSTLVKCIMSQIPFEGKLELGHNVKIGYFAQNQADLMDEKPTVFQTIDNVAVGDIRTKIRDILGAFMFGGEASDKKVEVLSGGERTRLAMIKLLLEPVNLLILDEPTNHLDMRTKDVLKEAIKAFDGTVIVVSHDRDFLDGLVDKVYEFGNQRVREHLGGIYEFLRKNNGEFVATLAATSPTTAVQIRAGKPRPYESSAAVGAGSARPVPSTQDYQQRKDQQKQQKRMEKSIADIEKKIETLENEIKAMEAILSTPEGAANTDLLWQHADKHKLLDAAMEEWAKLCE